MGTNANDFDDDLDDDLDFLDEEDDDTDNDQGDDVDSVDDADDIDHLLSIVNDSDDEEDDLAFLEDDDDNEEDDDLAFPEDDDDEDEDGDDEDYGDDDEDDDDIEWADEEDSTTDEDATEDEDPEVRQRQEESIDAIEQGIAQGITAFTKQLAEALNIELPEGEDPLQGIVSSVKDGPGSTAARDLAIHLAVKDTDIDPVALTDSISFTQSLEALNPADSDYQTKVADAVQAAASKNRTLKVAPTEGRSGGDFMGGAGTKTPENDVEGLQRRRRERRKHR